MLLKHPPDVLALDLRMGGMELLERVRTNHPQIQVIILTGHGGEESEKEARDRGAFDYLEKPVDYPGLRKVINRSWDLTRRVSKAVADDIRLTFWEGLPQEAPKPALPSGPPWAKLPGDGLKVLLVDDEEGFVRTLSERLELRDMPSEVALSGKKRFPYWERNRLT